MEVTVKVRIAWLLTLLFWIVASCLCIPFMCTVFEYTTPEFFDVTTHTKNTHTHSLTT